MGDGVHGRFVRVVDLKSLALHRCVLNCGTLNSFMWGIYPEIMHGGAPEVFQKIKKGQEWEYFT